MRLTKKTKNFLADKCPDNTHNEQDEDKIKVVTVNVAICKVNHRPAKIYSEVDNGRGGYKHIFFDAERCQG